MKPILFVVFATLTVLTSPLLAIAAQGPPAMYGVALVVASPAGQSIGDILKASDMTDAFPGRAPIGAFVVLEDADSLQRLRENGAWFVIDGKRILAFC